MADKLLKSIKFPTLPDRYVIGDTSLSEAGAAAEAKAVGEALATKADTKGTYEDLIAGGAEQLMADEYETDKEPYLFRTTGGSADVGNREYLDSIVGGTVAWNQLVGESNLLAYTSSAGVVTTKNGDGTLTINGTATGAFRITQNLATKKSHVYFATDANKQVRLYNGTPAYGVTNKDIGGLIKDTSSDSWNLYCYENGTAFNDTKVKPMLIDLTALFNPTIADYIYSLEQATAGAGVAWFRRYFPKDYYPYDPGTLRSVEGVSAHETVGFNQWDEEWEEGAISILNGQNVAVANSIRSKNYSRCLGNTDYCIQSPNVQHYIMWYDGDKNFIGGSFAETTTQVATSPSDAQYFKIRADAYGTTYNHDICINISDPTRNGEYEPYQKHTYPLDNSLTLRGVTKLVDGKLAFDGDVYPPSGEVQRRYGIVDLGTLDWYYSNNIFFAKLTNGNVTDAYLKNLICTKYPTTIAGNYNVMGDKELIGARGYQQANVVSALIKDSAYTDAATFKTAMSGVYLVYELATLTTETAEGYEQYQICDPSGTEEFVTDSIVPVGHETRYPHDLKKKIETAPDSPSTDGTYLMKRSGGKNTYMALPSTPSANGAYVLTVTVSGGSASYSWTAKE